MAQKNKYEMNMCEGSLAPKILMYALPLILSGILQLLFNAADIIVVGNYVGPDALAAVGSTNPLINLITNVFIGLSVGANVLVARFYGAGQDKELSDTVHTAISTALVSGLMLVVIGIGVAKPALVLMDSPAGVIDQSALYLRIYFAGMPAMMLYNFGSAVLRAIGDTRRPLYYLFSAGILNVILNYIFVVDFDMGVAGVACATIISQILSAALVLRCLMRADGAYKLVLRKLHIDRQKLLKMVQIGLPAGVQGALFSISNVLIQKSINQFGEIAMAGNTAASNLEGFVYMAMNAMYQTAISFTGQNYGAMKYERIGKIALICQTYVILIGVIFGNSVYLGSRTLLRLYSPDAKVIAYGVTRLAYICTVYALCGMMDTMVGVLRGMGYGIMPMLVSLTGACLFRIVWIMTIFQKFHKLEVLYASYGISWIMTFSVHLLCFLIIYRKLRKSIYPANL